MFFLGVISWVIGLSCRNTNKGGTACERPVERPGAGADDEHRKCHADHEQVILKALSRLGPCPVHKEAVAPMHSDKSDEHLTDEDQGDHPGEETHGKTERSRRTAGRANTPCASPKTPRGIPGSPCTWSWALPPRSASLSWRPEASSRLWNPVRKTGLGNLETLVSALRGEGISGYYYQARGASPVVVLGPEHATEVAAAGMGCTRSRSIFFSMPVRPWGNSGTAATGVPAPGQRRGSTSRMTSRCPFPYHSSPCSPPWVAWSSGAAFLPQTVTGAHADGTRPLVGPRCFPRRPRPYPSASRRRERRSVHCAGRGLGIMPRMT